MEANRTQLPWRRILVESAAVILSILLAFAIDAAWEARQERDHETVLLSGLLFEFRSVRPDLVTRVSTARRLRHNSVILRDQMAEAAGAGPVEVPDSILMSVIGGPTFQPAINTLDAALASGKIELILDNELRNHLAQWRTILADTYESEKEVRAIATARIGPLIARDVALGWYFDNAVSMDAGPFETQGSAKLTPTLELSGAIAARAFYGQFAAEGLASLLSVLDTIVSLIEADLN